MTTKTKKASKTKAKKTATSKPDNHRSAEVQALWGDRNPKRLGTILDADYCGKLTVREVATIAAVDSMNFPLGLDTPLLVGDFEGNFSACTLSVMQGELGAPGESMCIVCDPHEGMR